MTIVPKRIERIYLIDEYGNKEPILQDMWGKLPQPQRCGACIENTTLFIEEEYKKCIDCISGAYYREKHNLLEPDILFDRYEHDKVPVTYHKPDESWEETITTAKQEVWKLEKKKEKRKQEIQKIKEKHNTNDDTK